MRWDFFINIRRLKPDCLSRFLSGAKDIDKIIIQTKHLIFAHSPFRPLSLPHFLPLAYFSAADTAHLKPVWFSPVSQLVFIRAPILNPEQY
jgi:hypothetical protein